MNCQRTLALLMLCSATAQPALASDKLYRPYVEQGELELEYFGSRSNDSDATKNNAQNHQFSVGYGVNEWWHTEVYGKVEKEPQSKTTFDAWEWENIFQLTERGEHWLDVGASLAYEYTPQRNRSDAIEGRLLLEKDFTKTTHVLNVILEKEVASGPKDGLEAGFLWSSRYNLTSYFEPGFEISSSFGEIKHTGSFDDQQHYIGPTAYGTIPLHMTERGDKIKYRIGYLFGVSQAASSGDAIAQVEYEIHF